MAREAESVRFDAAALVDLLRAALPAWSLAATVRIECESPFAVQVQGAHGVVLRVTRINDSRHSGERWCCGPVGLPAVLATQTASLAGVLLHVRLALDEHWSPTSLIMGLPMATTTNAGAEVATGATTTAGRRAMPKADVPARREARADAAPIAVHVLTGFLGSGKTTLLNRLIRDPALANSAIVVNEFGDVGVDHLLVSEGADVRLALVGGCLCCELRDGLALTLVDLLARRRRGLCPAFERIIIETTGLADPMPIMNVLATDAVLAESTRMGAIVTVVDALNAPHTLARFAQARAQVALADQIVVSKTDLPTLSNLPDTSGVGLVSTLRALNDTATVHERGIDASLVGDELLSVALRHQPRAALPPSSHAPHAHLDGVHSFTLRRDACVPGAALTLFVQALVAQFGDALLRVKGVVRLVEAPQRAMVLQGAQRVFCPLAPLDEASAHDDEDGVRLVFIVQRAHSRDLVERLFDALVGEVNELSQRVTDDARSGATPANPQGEQRA